MGSTTNIFAPTPAAAIPESSQETKGVDLSASKDLATFSALNTGSEGGFSFGKRQRVLPLVAQELPSLKLLHLQQRLLMTLLPPVRLLLKMLNMILISNLLFLCLNLS